MPEKTGLLEDAKDKVLFQACLDHPLPWNIEQDWTLEVRDANGALVAKCLTPDSARALIEWAENTADELAEYNEDNLPAVNSRLCEVCDKPVTHNGTVCLSMGRSSFCSSDCVDVWDNEECQRCGYRRIEHPVSKGRLFSKELVCGKPVIST